MQNERQRGGVCGSNACRSAPPGIRPSSRETDSSADKRVSERQKEEEERRKRRRRQSHISSEVLIPLFSFRSTSHRPRHHRQHDG